MRVILVFLMLLSAASSSYAAGPFNVDSVTDAVDAAVGDGNCDTGIGTCTMRAAVQEANALVGADVIVLPAGTYILTLLPATTYGDLDVTENLTVNGAASDTTILDGNLLDRIFEVVSSGVSLTLQDLQLRRGQVPLSTDEGGAIRTNGSLQLTRTMFQDNTAGKGGGAIWTGAALNITDSAFVNNSVIQSSADGGGAIECHGLTDIYTTLLSGNSSSNDGGAIENYGTLSLYDSTLTENTAEDDGGAIENDGVSLVLANSGVYNNHAYTSDGSGGGGALYFTGSGGTISNTVFAGNTSNNDGGAIYTSWSSSISGSLFSANRSCDDGGGIAIDNVSLVTIDDSDFFDNYAGDNTVNGAQSVCSSSSGFDGGAINNYDSSSASGTKAVLNNCHFRGNTAVQDGGAVHNYRATIEISDSLFEQNQSLELDDATHSGGDGGALRNANNAVATITNSDFVGNSSNDDGGAIQNEESDMVLSNALIKDNETNDLGGGLRHSSGGSIVLSNLVFSGNSAAFGGGIANTVYDDSPATSMQASGLAFYSNSASFGGAVSSSGDLQLYNTTISNNSATMYGGGLYVSGTSTRIGFPSPAATLYDLEVFGNNVSMSGAGVYITDGGIATLYDSNIFRNAATGKAGGIGIGDPLKAKLYSLGITANYAAKGAGLGIITGPMSGYNLTITGNGSLRDGGGVWFGGSAPALLTNVTISYNRADTGNTGIGDGGGLYVATTGLSLRNTLMVQNTDLSGEADNCSGSGASAGGNVLGTGCFLTGNSDIQTSDPKLGDIRVVAGIPVVPLLWDSPAIEAGSPSGCPAEDIRGIARPVGVRCDAGAYEYRGADLVMSGSAPLTQIPWNGGANLVLRVDNNGPYPATGSTLSVTLSDGLKMVSSTPAICVDDPVGAVGARIDCPLGELSVGSWADVQVNVQPAHGGLLGSTATAAAAVVDANGGVDNSLVLDLDVQLAADLEVTLEAPVTAEVGSPAPWLLELTNHGPDPAHNVVVSLSGSNSSTLIGKVEDRADCSLAGLVAECSLADLGVDESVAITLNYQGTITGAEERSALVSAIEYDMNEANNQATESVTIVKSVNEIGVGTGVGSPLTDSTVEATDSAVPVLQFTLAGEDLQYVLVHGFVLLPGGDGDEVAGIRAVKLFVDGDADGKVDPGSSPVTVDVYSEDNEALTMNLPKALAVGATESVTFLVTYDFIGARKISKEARIKAKPAILIRSAGFADNSWTSVFMVVLLFGVAFSGVTRRRLLVLVLIFGVWGCSEKIVYDESFEVVLPPGVQFQVSLVEIIATSADGNTPVEIAGLPVQGPVFTIR